MDHLVSTIQIEISRVLNHILALVRISCSNFPSYFLIQSASSLYLRSVIVDILPGFCTQPVQNWVFFQFMLFGGLATEHNLGQITFESLHSQTMPNMFYKYHQGDTWMARILSGLWHEPQNQSSSSPALFSWCSGQNLQCVSWCFLGVLFNNAVICWYYIILVLDEWMSIANWWNNDRGTWMYLKKNQSLVTSSTINPTLTGPEMNPGLSMKKPVTNYLRHGTGPTRKWNFSQLYTMFLPSTEIDKQVHNSRKPDVPQKLVSLQIQNFFFWHYSPWLTLASSKTVLLHCSLSCNLCLQFPTPMLLRLSSTDWSHLNLSFPTCECLLA